MLSDNIRKHQKLIQMSQDELAEKLGVTRQSISLWETGQTQPSLDNVVALAKVFGISTDNLLTDGELVTANAGVVNTAAAEVPKKGLNGLVVCLAVIAGVIVSLLVAVLLWQSGIFQSETANNSQSAATVSPTTTVPPQNDDLPKDIDIYGYLKDYVIQNGTINGDYCYYSKSADHYGGYGTDDFSLYYWGDTETIEFCLHRVLDETYSINFYILVPKTHTGVYEYISSYYYRETGEPLYEARGTIVAGEFTDSYPLNCVNYTGSADQQNEFMETSRKGVCNLITCLKKFISEENIEYSFLDFGFSAF